MIGCVGVAVVDLVFSVPSYPAEDGEVRGRGLLRRRGGNASSWSVVLRQLGRESVFFGSCLEEGASVEAACIWEDLRRHGVDVSGVTVRAAGSGSVPTSFIPCSEASGSRTIFHVRDLKEQSALELFQRLFAAHDGLGAAVESAVGAGIRVILAGGGGEAGKGLKSDRTLQLALDCIRETLSEPQQQAVRDTLSRFAWFHVEGRVPATTLPLLLALLALRPSTSQPHIALEAEKTRGDNLQPLLRLADSVIASTAFAAHLALGKKDGKRREEGGGGGGGGESGGGDSGGGSGGGGDDGGGKSGGGKGGGVGGKSGVGVGGLIRGKKDDVDNSHRLLEAVVDAVGREDGVVVVVTLGADGAIAMDETGTVVRVESAPIPGGKVVDSTGAGDTFQAAYIHARLEGKGLEAALKDAAKLAAKKLAIHGLDVVRKEEE